MLGKLLTPGGLIIVLILLAIIFLPRRLPDVAKKLHKPMRAFPDEPTPPEERDDERPRTPREP
jgi:Sec-independent protein translocase protein TatA